jgi:hypothetical protein
MSDLILNLFFLSVIIEGAIRKWVAPGLSLEIQFFRDILPALAFIISRQQPHIRPQLGRFTGLAATLFCAYAGVAAIEMCSPSLPVFVVLVGIRTHFAYLPLAFLMPAYLKSWPHGLRKFRQLLILAMPIFLLGFFQTTQPVGSVWNKYADPTMAVATFGAGAPETVRATGTFAYLAEFANFAGICAIIIVFLMLTTNSKNLGKLLHAGVLGMALGAIMASGSRGPAIVFAVQVLGIAALGHSVRALPPRRLFSLVAFTLLALALSVTVFDRQATDFLLRAQAADDAGGRIDRGFFEWLSVMYQYPLGVGLGAGHQAVAVDMLATGTPNLWESELSRLAFELGVGVLIYLAFKVTLIGQFQARVKATRTRLGRIALATCTLTLAPLLIGSVYEPLTNAAFWAFVGIGFWVIKLEASAFPALPAVFREFRGTDPAGRGLSGVGAR